MPDSLIHADGARKSRRMWTWLCYALAMSSGPAVDALQAQSLVDVTPGSPFPQSGKTSGLAVTDLDGDSVPDLLLGTHSALPMAFRNLGEMRFEYWEDWGAKRGLVDHHATAISDIDRDGAAEIYLVCGAHRGRGLGPNELWTGPRGQRRNAAAQCGLRDAWGRGRAAMFLDVLATATPELLVLNFETAPRLFKHPSSAQQHWTDVLGQWIPGFPAAPVDTLADGRLAEDPDGTQRHRRRYWIAVRPHDVDGDLRPELLAWERNEIRLFGRSAADSLEPREGLLPPGLLRRRAADATFGDLDGDGQSDLYLVYGDGVGSSARVEANRLLLTRSGALALVEDHGAELRGIGHRCQAADLDNDGWLDLHVVRRRGPHRDAPNAILRNLGGGRFEDLSTAWGIETVVGGVAQDALPVDLDLDGDLDLIYAQGDHAFDRGAGGFRILRNDVARGSALLLELQGGPESSHEAFGAIVRVVVGGQSRIRQHWPAQCHGSSMPLPVHIGLGFAAAADSVIVRWPSGQVDRWTRLMAGHHRIIEGRR